MSLVLQRVTMTPEELAGIQMYPKLVARKRCIPRWDQEPVEELQKAEAAPAPQVREEQIHSSHGATAHRWLRPLELAVHNGPRWH